MSYNEFLKNIDKFIGKTAEFTVTFKNNYLKGKIFKMQRHIWDSKTFVPLREDADTQIIEVKVI